MTITYRSIVSLMAMLMLFAACGDQSLQRAGEGSSGWIGEGTPSTTTVASIRTTTTTDPPPPTVNLMAAVGLDWANDRMAPFSADTPKGVIELVWNASERSDSYIQAHRQTISRALPGIKVPAAIPDDVVHVTSQLVFGSSAELDDDWFAAFGFWTVPPYSESRAVGQAVVLHIGNAPSEDLSCDVLSRLASEPCRDTVVAGLGSASELVASDGVTLHWIDGAYRYRLFYRTIDAPETGALIAGSMIELTDLESRAAVAFRNVVSRLAQASPSAG